MSRFNWDKVRRQHAAERGGAERFTPETPEWRKNGKAAATDTQGATLVPRRKHKRRRDLARLTCHICGMQVAADRLDQHRRKLHSPRQDKRPEVRRR